MPTSTPTQLTSPNPKDPLGFGLKSIPVPLQCWWLVGKGNPYFEAEVREARARCQIPSSGFTNLEDYVDWVVPKYSRHGHSNWAEKLTRHHYGNASWPVHDFYLPGRCCSTDPFFKLAESLAIRFGIDLAEEEPGFEDPTRAVVEYLLLNHWPEARSLRDSSVIRREIAKTYRIVPGKNVQFVENARPKRSKFRHQELGLDATKGLGGKLPIWYQWWKLHAGGMTLDKIAGIAVETSNGEKFYEERMVSIGVDKVEELMRPKEILNTP